MSDAAKNVITILVTCLVCIGIGAVVLNFIAPNATKLVCNTIEATLYNATGLAIDLNGDGTKATTAMGAGNSAINTSGFGANTYLGTDATGKANGLTGFTAGAKASGTN